MAESPFRTSSGYRFDPIPKPSASSSTATSSTSSVNDQWRQIQSYHAAKRQQTQAERLKQLQDLERQVTDVASWTQQRTELVTTPIRRTLSKEDERTVRSLSNDNSMEQVNSARSSFSLASESRCVQYDSSTSDTRRDSHPIVDETSRTREKFDLSDASLEDLEGLIAASAQRLANYRLRKIDGSRRRTQSSNAANESGSGTSDTFARNKHDDVSRLKNLLDGHRTRDETFYYRDMIQRHSIDMAASSHLHEEIGNMDDSCDGMDASFVTTFTTLSEDTAMDANCIATRDINVTVQASAGESGSSHKKGTADMRPDKELLHMSPLSALYTGIRSKPETRMPDTPKDDARQFDPLVPSLSKTKHTSSPRLSNESFLASKSSRRSKESSPGPSFSSNMSLSKSLTRGSMSSNQLMKEANDKPKRRPADLASLDMNNLGTRANGPQSLDSPQAPTKLPTPRTGHTSSTTFPRSSLPASHGSPRQRLRTLSTVDRSDSSLKWVDSEIKLANTGIISTKSTYANATPKIDHPRLSTSTTPRTSRFKIGNADRKQTDSSPAYKHSSSSLTCSTSLPRTLEKEVRELENLRRSRKPSIARPAIQTSQSVRLSRDDTNTLPARSRKVSILTPDQTQKDLVEPDSLSERDLLLEGTQTYGEEARHETESPKALHGNKENSEDQPSAKVRLMPPNPQTRKPLYGDGGKSSAAKKNPVKRTTGRKRGKTLPGNLASPPAMASLALPPMKLEPISLTIPGGRAEDSTKTPSRSTARTPTRIPLPVQKASRQCKHEAESLSTASSDDELLATPEKDRLRSVSATQAKKTTKDNYLTVGTPKVGLTTTVYSGATVGSNSTSARPTANDTKTMSSTSSRKPKTATASPMASRSNRTTNILPRSRKVSTASAKLTVSSSAKTTSNSSELHEVDPNRRKVATLHGRLQGLVYDSNTWSSQVEHENNGRKHQERKPTEIVVLRGGGSSSTSTTASAREEAAKLDATHDDTHWQKPKTQALRIAVSPQAAIKLYHSSLSPFENTEIMDYSHVYFTGNHSKKRQATCEQTACNHGYDDDRGDYQIVLRDHLAYRFEVLEVLGKGSFGQVLKCFDHKSGKTVAVKVIRNKKRFHAQALVEVKILEDLILWDPEDKHNNIRMVEHFYFRNHLCIAFECLSINLYDFIKSNEFQGFSNGLIRRFTMQILNSLSLLRKHKLIHCDLKPENILLKHPNKSSIKIIDFGSSCLENEKVYTYIQSRFYRSPEVILGMNYSMAIDMWSVGCILAELDNGYPLFPGENEQEQLACIMEIKGVPDTHLVEKSTRRKLFFDSYGTPRIMPNSKGKKRRPGTKKLADVLRSSDENFVDFVDQCLNWDPEKRLTPDEASRHPWIIRSTRGYHPRT
ncbi:hypothetical protein DFQ28_002602 [Apophysomyces sp. BC1034]|nr:hypothetical protein DFQ28_002602 [Apophysomyces sp. BC1034]